MTRSSGSFDAARILAGAPGDGLAEAQERDAKNDERDGQQPDEFEALAGTLASVPVFGFLLVRRKIGVHSVIVEL